MIISATDFQLSVNEYFTKLIQGEEVIIERYGKKFAVLVPYEKFAADQDDSSLTTASGEEVNTHAKNDARVGSDVATAKGAEGLSPGEVVALLKLLLKS